MNYSFYKSIISYLVSIVTLLFYNLFLNYREILYNVILFINNFYCIYPISFGINTLSSRCQKLIRINLYFIHIILYFYHSFLYFITHFLILLLISCIISICLKIEIIIILIILYILNTVIHLVAFKNFNSNHVYLIEFRSSSLRRLRTQVLYR